MTKSENECVNEKRKKLELVSFFSGTAVPHYWRWVRSNCVYYWEKEKFTLNQLRFPMKWFILFIRCADSVYFINTFTYASRFLYHFLNNINVNKNSSQNINKVFFTKHMQGGFHILYLFCYFLRSLYTERVHDWIRCKKKNKFKILISGELMIFPFLAESLLLNLMEISKEYLCFLIRGARASKKAKDLFYFRSKLFKYRKH